MKTEKLDCVWLHRLLTFPGQVGNFFAQGIDARQALKVEDAINLQPVLLGNAENTDRVIQALHEE